MKLSPPSPLKIDLQIHPAYRKLVSSGYLRAVVEATLRHEAIAAGEVTVVIGDDELLQQLNRQYREIDAPTDVLSFAAREDDQDEDLFVSAPEAADYLGDVVISFPTAQRQANAAGQPTLAELGLLAVHGVLHLLGYDHTSEEEEADMWMRQAAILAEVPLIPYEKS